MKFSVKCVMKNDLICVFQSFGHHNPNLFLAIGYKFPFQTIKSRMEIKPPYYSD